MCRVRKLVREPNRTLRDSLEDVVLKEWDARHAQGDEGAECSSPADERRNTSVEVLEVSLSA